jgi:hypothetical protein
VKPLVFLHLPDQFAGLPLSIEEAVKRIGIGDYPQEQQIPFTVDQLIACDRSASRVLWLNLATGTLTAAVQCAELGAWSRIPAGFWTRDTKQPPDDIDPLMADLTGSPGFRTSLAGQPIVLWKADVEALAARLRSSFEKLKAERAAADPPAEVEDQVGVLALDPNPKPYGPKTPHATLVNWYKARVAGSPVGGYSRREDEIAGSEVGIARDRTRDLRRDWAPPEWSISGRKRH